MTAEVARDVAVALEGVADPAYEVSVSFTGMDAYGTHGTVWVHVKEDATFSAAQDRVARVLQGRPWLADAIDGDDAGEKVVPRASCRDPTAPGAGVPTTTTTWRIA